MRKIFLFTVLGMCCLLVGCSTGIPQEKYESVAAERDALKQKLESLEAEETDEAKKADVPNAHSSDEKKTVISETERNETSETKGNKESTESKNGDVEVLAEYTLRERLGPFTTHVIIVKNNSNEAVNISTSTLAYSENGAMIGAANGSFTALGVGCTSVLDESFRTKAQISRYEIELNTSPSRNYKSAIEDLSFVQNDLDDGAIFQVTNNGKDPVEFVEGYALFFLNNELVGYESTSFRVDDFQIQPGQTVSKQVTSYEAFDRIEFYLSGKKDYF